MVSGFVTLILFFSYIYPNLKKPNWERKIVSANYIRVRNRAAIADDVLIDAIKSDPNAWQLYMNLFQFYATPWDMKKLYDVMAFGAKTTDYPGVLAHTAWCLMEEGEFEKAEEMLKREDVEEYLLEHSIQYLPLLYFKQGKYEECEKAFISFHKKIYDTLSTSDSNNINEEKIFADLSSDELIILVISRKKLDKEWRSAAKIIPATSVHEENNWTSYYEKLLKYKENLKVETGIYGPPEKLFSLREKEINKKIEIVKEILKIK
jgi:tetratricopeptide (TPR) repeat protein